MFSFTTGALDLQSLLTWEQWIRWQSSCSYSSKLSKRKKFASSLNCYNTFVLLVQDEANKSFLFWNCFIPYILLLWDTEVCLQFELLLFLWSLQHNFDLIVLKMTKTLWLSKSRQPLTNYYTLCFLGRELKKKNNSLPSN